MKTSTETMIGGLGDVMEDPIDTVHIEDPLGRIGGQDGAIGADQYIDAKKPHDQDL